MSIAKTLEVPVEVLVRVKIDVSPGLRELLVEAGWAPPPSGEAGERRINDEPHPRPPGKPLPPPSKDDDDADD